MIALQRGLEMAHTLHGPLPLDLSPLAQRLGLEIVPWRFRGRLREVIVDAVIGIDDRLPSPWVRWLTAHAIGHHLLHTGTWLYLDSWQWVARVKAERQAEEFAAGLFMPSTPALLALGPATLARRLGIPEAKALWSWPYWTLLSNPQPPHDGGKGSKT